MSNFKVRRRGIGKLSHKRQLTEPGLLSTPESLKLVSTAGFCSSSQLKDLSIDVEDLQFRSDDFRRIYQELNKRITQRTELSRRLQKISMQIKENEERIKVLEHALGLKPMPKKQCKESTQLSPIEVIFRGSVWTNQPAHKKQLLSRSFDSDLHAKLRECLTPRSVSQETYNEVELLEKDRQLIIFSIAQDNKNTEKAAKLMAGLFEQIGEHITALIPNKNDQEKVSKKGNVVSDEKEGMAKWKWDFRLTLDMFENDDEIPGTILFFTEGYRFNKCNTQLWEMNEVAKRNLLSFCRLVVFDEARPLEPQLSTLWLTKTSYLEIGYPLNFFLLDKWEGSTALWNRVELFFKTTDFRVGDKVEAKHKDATGYHMAIVKKVHRWNMDFDIYYDDSKTLEEVWGSGAGMRLRCPRHDIKPNDTNAFIALACSQPLIFAAQNGLHVTIKYLIKWTKSSLGGIDIDINCTNEDGNTPLHIACHTGNMEVMRVLLENRANPSIKNDNDMTCLVLAAGQGFKAIVEELLRKLPLFPNDDRPNLSEALRMSAAKGKLSTAATLVKNKADVNAKDDGGRSALIFAAMEGHQQMCKYLISLNADFEHSDKYGQTALIWASAGGHFDVIAVLLEARAKADAEDNEGQTPLIWAASEGFEEICEMLLEYGANPEGVDAEWGRSPLMRAAMESNLDTILILADYNANLEAHDYDGRTAFMLATEFADQNIVISLVDELKVDVDAKDNNERTALIEAAKNGKLDTVMLLLKVKADVSKRDKFGWNALMWAAKSGSVDVLECLLNANPEEVNSEIRGATALIRAATAGHAKAVELLLKFKADCEARERSENQTALMKAAQGGHEKVITKLLMFGADATAMDDNQETALSLARKRSLGNIETLLQEFKNFPGMTSKSEKPKSKKTPFLLAPENMGIRNQLSPIYVGRGHSSSVVSSSGGSVITVIDQIQADLRKGKGRHPRSSIIWS